MNEKQVLWGLLPSYISWVTIVLAVLTLGTFIAVSQPNYGYPIPMMGWSESGGTNAVPPMSGGAPAYDAGQTSPSRGGADMYYPYPYPNPDVPVTDAREFLKIYYSAQMQTRDVSGLTRRVETTVRGYGGRVDNQSISTKYGSVSFAVPQSKFDAFRTEIESFVGSRFLTVNVSSQNLLSQKVSIEEQLKQANKALADYKTERQKLVSAHASAVQSLQAKIDADTTLLETLRAQPSMPQISAQIQTVSDELASLKKQLASENSTYTNRLESADANIKYAADWVKGVETQDETLLANVATVTGTVSVQWVSLWDMAQAYLPGYWIPALFALLTFLSYLRDRRRHELALVP